MENQGNTGVLQWWLHGLAATSHHEYINTRIHIDSHTRTCIYEDMGEERVSKERKRNGGEIRERCLGEIREGIRDLERERARDFQRD